MEFHETERNINNKISRGGFNATFFVQCLSAACPGRCDGEGEVPRVGPKALKFERLEQQHRSA